MVDSVRKHIDITPDKSLMPKIGGGAGYSVPQAIAELVDNAIDAHAEDKVLRVDITLKRDFIEISDNATGMDEQTAARCLKLAHSSKKGKLGEFGLGLKTACLSLGRRFTINTTTEESEDAYHIAYDEDEWMRNGDLDWKKYPLHIVQKEDASEHGTSVRIFNLKVSAHTNSTYIREDLSKRFAPFITSGQLIISVNGKKCVPQKLELTEGGKKDFRIDLGDGKSLWGWYGLLRESSQKGFYGFSTFRRGRMITTFDKIGIKEHATIARIIGEIHMDHVPVTHNKREWIKESPEYVEAIALLSEEFKEIQSKARKMSKSDKLTPQLIEKKNVWLEKIAEVVKLPELRDYAKPNVTTDLSSDLRGSDTSNVPPAEMEIEKRDSGENPIQQELHEYKGIRERNPKKTHVKKVHVITIKGKKYRFTHDFATLGEEANWKEYAISDDKGIEIFTNIDFPAWDLTKDKVFYAIYHVAESLAEIMVLQANENPQRIEEIKELILRKSSELMEQFKEEEDILRKQQELDEKLHKIRGEESD